MKDNDVDSYIEPYAVTEDCKYKNIASINNNNNNNGGRNSFYDIPSNVKNVDDLAKYLKANGPVFNVLKSLFGLNKKRHTGTSSVRDSKKMLHYSIQNLLWQNEYRNRDVADVFYELYLEMSPEEQHKIGCFIIEK